MFNGRTSRVHGWWQAVGATADAEKTLGVIGVGDASPSERRHLRNDAGSEPGREVAQPGTCRFIARLSPN